MNRFNPFVRPFVRPVPSRLQPVESYNPPQLSAINELAVGWPGGKKLIDAVWNDPDALYFLYTIWRMALTDPKRQRDSGWIEYRTQNPATNADSQAFQQQHLDAANRTIILWDNVIEAIRQRLTALGRIVTTSGIG